MRARHRFVSASTALLALLLIVPAHGMSLNKSIKIGDGEESDGASTVNGSISIGDGAVVTGSVSTVNGTIRVGNDATVEQAETVNGSLRVSDGVRSNDLSSVNGSVSIGSKVRVDGSVTLVNGKISIESGTSVSHDVSNVNGEIKLRGTEVGGDLSTVNGDVLLVEQSILHGDLTVDKPSGWGKHSGNRKPRVVIGPGSRVEGTIILKQAVDLFVSETAEIGNVSGVMTKDDAVRFSGTHP